MRGVTPPVSSASAASRLSRSSASVPEPARTPRNSPSGLSVRRIWISMPGMSFSSCSDSSETARPRLSGSSGTWPGAAIMPSLSPSSALSASTRRISVALPAPRTASSAAVVWQNSRAALPNCRSTVARRSPRSSAARCMRKSAPGTARARARRLRLMRSSVSMIGCTLVLPVGRPAKLPATPRPVSAILRQEPQGAPI